MSGGHFDYAYQRVQTFTDDLESQLGTFDGETKEALAAIVLVARGAARLMKEAEWLYSGDTSEEIFLERVGTVLNGLEAEAVELQQKHGRDE